MHGMKRRQKVTKKIEALVEAIFDLIGEEEKTPVNQIREEVGDPALYENLAEEAVELAHKALKAARIIRGENPTPAQLEAVLGQIRAELSDVTVVADVLEIYPDPEYMIQKYERWINRLNNR